MPRSNIKHGVPAKPVTPGDKPMKPDKQKRKRRRKRVKSEIMRLGRTTHLLNSKASFHREARKTLMKFNPQMRITSNALEALQEAAEAALTEALMSANAIATKCAGRAGPLLKDMQTAVRIGHPHLTPQK